MPDFSNPAIQQLIEHHGWRSRGEFDRIQAIYNDVRDEILFGYNTDDSIPASKVLADGYGQCNTKGTLFMALLRGYGAAVRDFRHPVIEFNRNNTYIQSEGINQDISLLKAFVYRNIGRHLMNANGKESETGNKFCIKNRVHIIVICTLVYFIYFAFCMLTRSFLSRY